MAQRSGEFSIADTLKFDITQDDLGKLSYNYEAFKQAVAQKPLDCLVGLDFNYRSTVKAILPPLPQLEIVPLGGVSLNTAAEFKKRCGCAGCWP